MRSQATRHIVRRQPVSFLCYVFGFLGILIGLLSGCSSRLPSQPSLPLLNAPGLIRLDSFASLEAETGVYSVKSLLAYNSGKAPDTAHLLVLQGGNLLDATLNGADTIQTIQAPTCFRLGDLARSSKQILCQGQTEDGSLGIIAFHPGTSSSMWSGRLLVSAAAPGDGYSSPAWKPDGKVFAVVHVRDNTRSIDFFTVDASLQTVQQIATLRLVQMPQIIIQSLSWSPDGAWLTFAGGDGHIDATYGLRISTLLGQPAPLDGNIQQIAVKNDQLVTIVHYAIIGQAWQPTTNNLVYFDFKRLMELNVLTGQRHELLAIPDGNICGMTWTPDGHRLIFAHCGIGTPDSAAPPSQIYIYTIP